MAYSCSQPQLEDINSEGFESLLLFVETDYQDAIPYTALDMYEAATRLGVGGSVKQR